MFDINFTYVADLLYIESGNGFDLEVLFGNCCNGLGTAKVAGKPGVILVDPVVVTAVEKN
ncbi:hypothetical protein AB1A81_11010 [Bdellovibrio bacteriovorus]|uniref:hypothetical protein n=1 Tax=Bdellovibrio bacteriovorus TaxID=959 RepID=UPI000A658381|nr:hypothetical protein [Bdellovibrio bacteriovorus]